MKEEVLKTQARNIMEIGTWNGEHAALMIRSSLQFHSPTDIYYYGFDLFEDLTPETSIKEIARGTPPLDEVRRKIHESVHPRVNLILHKGDTKIILSTLVPRLPKMDFIFIDGGHSFETVKSDWINCQQLMHGRTVVIFDDYVNSAAIENEGYGVNQVVEEIDTRTYKIEFLTPVDWFPHKWGIFKTRFVKVTLR